MPYLLRRVTFANWQGGRPPVEDVALRALQDFALSGADLDGLSVFHAAGDPERNLIVAAIACGRKNTDKVDLLEIPEADVEALGTVTVTMGTTPVARANLLHRSLAWSQLLLDQLATSLLDRGQAARRHNKAAVAAAVAALALEDVEAG